MILVDLEKVSARRPDRPLFEDLSLTLQTGDRLGLVGRNGTGKSTLMRVLAGEGEPESGVVRRGRGVRVGFLGQNPQLPAGTVMAAVTAAAGEGAWEAAAVLERLGMGGLVDVDVAILSGGQSKRVALAQVLVREVDLLILDEPTNYLDVDAIAWLEDRLARFRGGLVLVTHDRHVLDRVTTRILELDRGRGYVHEGGYASYLEAKAERAEREATAETVRRNLARSELAWLRRGAPARTRKPKAHIARATAIVENRGPAQDRATSIELAAAGRGAATPRLGDQVITLTGVGHSFDGVRWLFRKLDLDLEPGGRVGIVGPNGTGKSTLLEILAGRLRPTEGTVTVGPTVKVGYYDQLGAQLDPGQRAREAVAGTAGQPSWEQGRLMEQFWFDADAQWAQVGTLSGGERRRLQLLIALGSLPNVLLLDEPTNDLDLDTLRALEDYLEAWPGTLVVVSHDRALLERTVEDVVVLTADGKHRTGLYAQYEEARRRSAGGTISRQAAAVSPPKPTAARSATEAAAEPKAAKARSASTLRRLIDQAEKAMGEAEAERDRQAAALGAVPGDDHVALGKAAHDLAEAEAKLAAAEERWLALAEELGM